MLRAVERATTLGGGRGVWWMSAGDPAAARTDHGFVDDCGERIPAAGGPASREQHHAAQRSNGRRDNGRSPLSSDGSTYRNTRRAVIAPAAESPRTLVAPIASARARSQFALKQHSSAAYVVAEGYLLLQYLFIAWQPGSIPSPTGGRHCPSPIRCNFRSRGALLSAWSTS